MSQTNTTNKFIGFSAGTHLLAQGVASAEAYERHPAPAKVEHEPSAKPASAVIAGHIAVRQEVARPEHVQVHINTPDQA